jgi:hypothetical protein
MAPVEVLQETLLRAELCLQVLVCGLVYITGPVLNFYDD